MINGQCAQYGPQFDSKTFSPHNKQKKNQTDSKALASTNICLTYESSFKDPRYLGKYVT